MIYQEGQILSQFKSDFFYLFFYLMSKIWIFKENSLKLSKQDLKICIKKNIRNQPNGKSVFNMYYKQSYCYFVCCLRLSRVIMITCLSLCHAETKKIRSKCGMASSTFWFLQIHSTFFKLLFKITVLFFAGIKLG